MIKSKVKQSLILGAVTAGCILCGALLAGNEASNDYASAASREQTPLTVKATPCVGKLPYRESCKEMPDSTEWQTLYGTVKAEENGWIADNLNKWGIITDFGCGDYVFQSWVNISGSAGEAGKYGFLVHASADGRSGLLIGLEMKNGKLWATAGWLDNGGYTLCSSSDIYFDRQQNYYVNLTVEGSVVQLTVNGWRALTFYDKFCSGGKFAILNDGGTKVIYRDIKCSELDDSIADNIFRNDWNAETYACTYSSESAFDVTFDLPEGEAENFRLVRRTDLRTRQTAEISVGGHSYGNWSITWAQNFGDVTYALRGYEASGENLTVHINPAADMSFSASYMWLIYERDGVDYIADSVYMGHARDRAAHGVTGSVTEAQQQRIGVTAQMLLTTAAGERTVWARAMFESDELVLEKMQDLKYSDRAIANFDLPYRLYVPENYDKNKKYAVLLWMHGAGERGNDNICQVTKYAVEGTERLIKRVVLGKYSDDFIVVAPQCPADRRWVERDWTPGKYDYDKTPQSSASQMVSSLLYNEIFEKYSVDRSRIYGAGLSMGGFGITDIAMRHPELFAAVLNCCGGTDSSKAELLATTAYRVFHTQSDNVVNFQESYALVQNMLKAGYDAEYYEIDNVGHYEWLVGLDDPDLMDWFLSHRKVWTIKTQLNGGTLTQELPETYGSDLEKIELQPPVKQGYDFDGWYTDEEFKNEITYLDGSMATSLTLYAKWVRNVVLKLVSEGQTLETLTCENGALIDLSQFTPVREGYRLAGWTANDSEYAPDGKVILSADSSRELTLTAKWVRIFTVTFVSEEQTLNTLTLDINSKVELSKYASQRNGYVFKGWTADGKDYAPDGEITVTTDMRLTAKWEEEKFLVTVYDGDTAVFSQSIVKNGAINFTVPQKEGFEFVGYFSDKACTSAATLPQTATQDVTLYLKYKAIVEDEKSGCNGSVAVNMGAAFIGLASAAALTVVLKRRGRKN